MNNLISVASIIQASERLKNIITHTPLQENINLSETYQAKIYLKREDLQIVRSYKLRGAYNKIAQLTPDDLKNGVVCASAGNHAQGFAYACRQLNIQGTVFMPTPTPDQKVKQVRMFGKSNVEIMLVGDTYDDAFEKAMEFTQAQKATFVPPFEDMEVMSGQGTVGLEILADCPKPIDYLFLPIGGGGLSAGVGSYFKQVSPHTKIIGIEPEGAPAMKKSLEEGKVVVLDKIDKFVDGAAVKKVGDINFDICRQVLDQVITVPEGKVCTTILKLYNEEAIVVEPAGALSIAALDYFKEEIKGKKVVCVVSGGNNDITRMEEIKERSLFHEKLKHYFIINFPQRSGALKEFVVDVLSPTDDITYFEYTKKTNREKGPALVGIQVQKPEDFESLIHRLDATGFGYELLNNKPALYHILF
jgi:threonine dehydratase